MIFKKTLHFFKDNLFVTGFFILVFIAHQFFVIYSKYEWPSIPGRRSTIHESNALSQKHFLGSKYFKILHKNFRDMGGAVLGGGGGHTFRDMGGAVSRYGRC